MLVDASYAIT